jgi:hypothetical protein
VIKCRRTRWAGHVVRMGQTRNVCKIFVGRLKLRWEKNNRLDLREVVDWIHLAQDVNKLRAVLNMVVNLQFP